MEKRHLELAERQVRGLTVLLSVQFILGIILTTLINYDPHKSSAAQTTFLVLHIIVAAGLFAGSVFRLITSIRWDYLQIHSFVGLLAIVGALISGGIAAANGSGVAVFLMALGIMVAFGAYGNSASALTRQIETYRK